jgi:hypothetical protein
LSGFDLVHRLTTYVVEIYNHTLHFSELEGVHDVRLHFLSLGAHQTSQVGSNIFDMYFGGDLFECWLEH